MKIIVRNRKANFDYYILNTYEAGIALHGSEVKSVRQGKISIQDSYALIIEGEIYLYNMHISPYNKASSDIDPKRKRKLLLHKNQIRKIESQIMNKGLTIIPTEVYIERGLIKVKIASAKGKRKYEKRDKIVEKEQRREMRKHL